MFLAIFIQIWFGDAYVGLKLIHVIFAEIFVAEWYKSLKICPTLQVLVQILKIFRNGYQYKRTIVRNSAQKCVSTHNTAFLRTILQWH